MLETWIPAFAGMTALSRRYVVSRGPGVRSNANLGPVPFHNEPLSVRPVNNLNQSKRGGLKITGATDGIVGVAVLWLLVALSAMGLCALHLARWQNARAATRLSDVRDRLLIAGAAAVAQDANFAFVDRTENIGGAAVTMTRQTGLATRLIRVRCVARSERNDQTAEIGWKKIADAWRVYYWTEPS